MLPSDLLFVTRGYHLVGRGSRCISFDLFVYSIHREEEIVYFLTPEIFMSQMELRHSYSHLNSFLLKKYTVQFNPEIYQTPVIQLLYTRGDSVHLFEKEEELLEILNTKARHLFNVSIHSLK